MTYVSRMQRACARKKREDNMSRTSFPRGWVTKEKIGWRAHVNAYVYDPAQQESGPYRAHRSAIIGPRTLSKGEANRLKDQWVMRELGLQRSVRPDSRITLKTFAESVFFFEMEKKWRRPTMLNRYYMTRHYILDKIGDYAIEDITRGQLQIFLNTLADKYARGTMERIISLLKGLFEYATESDYIGKNPAKSVYLPQAKTHPKQWADRKQLANLFGAVTDRMDKCYLACAIFLALRSAELFGMKWKAFNFDELTFRVSSTAYRGVLYDDNAKTDASRKPIPMDELILPFIEEWREVCPDSSPDALVFPCMPSRGRDKGKIIPWRSYEFVNRRIRPLAKLLEIDPSLVTSQVMRRSALDDVAKNYSKGVAQWVARHAPENSTPGMAQNSTLETHYLDSVPKDVRDAIKTRTAKVLASVPSREKTSA
jgi:integrase